MGYRAVWEEREDEAEEAEEDGVADTEKGCDTDDCDRPMSR